LLCCLRRRQNGLRALTLPGRLGAHLTFASTIDISLCFVVHYICAGTISQIFRTDDELGDVTKFMFTLKESGIGIRVGKFAISSETKFTFIMKNSRTGERISHSD
jgi:hypothetical protein